MYWAKYKGVYFVEGMPSGASPIRAIDTKHDGWFSQSQLKSLDTIKDAMVVEVVAAGGNAVVSFTYGQKSTFWRSLMSIDDVFWSASSIIATVQANSLSS